MNLYQQLGVNSNAKKANIEAAYQKALLAIRARHDRGEDVTQERTVLDAAYEILSDPERREAYDDRLAAAQFNQNRKRPAATVKGQQSADGVQLKAARPKKAKGPKFGVGTVGIAASVFGMAYVFGSIAYTDRPNEPRVPTYDRFSAQTECERFVSDRLKAPSTADFAPMRDLKVSGEGKGPWSVEGYVDAQNSFGAKIRSRYSCIVTFDGDRVSLLGLSIQ